MATLPAIFTSQMPEGCIKVTQLSEFVYTCRLFALVFKCLILLIIDDSKEDGSKRPKWALTKLTFYH